MAQCIAVPTCPPLSGGSPREGARSELASAAATGGGGPQAPPTRTTSGHEGQQNFCFCCPKLPVAGVAQARHDVANLVEPLVDSRHVDRYVGMRLAQSLDAFWGSDE